MRASLALLGLLVGLPVARAETYVASVLVAGRTENGDPGGSIGVWGAHDLGGLYVGGELALSTFSAGSGVFSVALHAVAGRATLLSSRWRLLIDVGAGPCEQVDANIGLLRSKGRLDHEAWTLSAAARAGLVADVIRVQGSTWSIGITTEARSDLDGDAGVAAGIWILARI